MTYYRIEAWFWTGLVTLCSASGGTRCCDGGQLGRLSIPFFSLVIDLTWFVFRKYSTRQKQSIWETLPSDILIRILIQCELNDIYALSLVCRVLRRRIYQHEPAIAQEYLCRRLHQHYPAVLSSGDNLTFIYNLFPPPPPHYPATDGSLENNFPEYSLSYLSDLTRCWRTCIRLSFYLAESAVQHHLETDTTIRGVSEQEAIYSKAVFQLQDKLLHPMYVLRII